MKKESLKKLIEDGQDQYSSIEEYKQYVFDVIDIYFDEIEKGKLRKRLRGLVNDSTIKLEWDNEGWKNVKAPISVNEYNQKLVVLINETSAKLRKLLEPEGGVDCIITSPEINTMLCDLPQFQSNYNDEQYLTSDIFQTGILGGRFKVLIDPYLKHDIIILGRKLDIFDFEKDTKCAIFTLKNMRCFCGGLL